MLCWVKNLLCINSIVKCLNEPIITPLVTIPQKWMSLQVLSDYWGAFRFYAKLFTITVRLKAVTILNPVSIEESQNLYLELLKKL